MRKPVIQELWTKPTKEIKAIKNECEKILKQREVINEGDYKVYYEFVCNWIENSPEDEREISVSQLIEKVGKFVEHHDREKARLAMLNAGLVVRSRDIGVKTSAIKQLRELWGSILEED